MKKISEIVKWLFDRLAALTGLLVLWPVLLAVALLVRRRMPGGPVLFTQQRVGRGGEPFTMYKFRTMTVGHGGSSVSVAGEARITPLGATLRKYKLDELPELWNVLRGDMSFVGPRPDVPGYADKLTGADRDILHLRPGITGPASMKYRDEEALIARFVAMTDEERCRAAGREVPKGLAAEQAALWYNDSVIYPDKVRLNLYYYRHPSFVTDLRMIICTVVGKNMNYAGENI